MYEMVLKEPTRSLKEIFEVVRQNHTAQMDSHTKLLFLQDFPRFSDVKTTLLSMRRQVIPPDPKFMADIDLDLPVFFLHNGENIVKGDAQLTDGRRIILFSSKEHLKVLARARQILGDGTFRITPRQFYQTFIISAEVSSGVFVPAAFCLLPDKKKESYLSMFSLLNKALDLMGMELSAEFFMSDFEIGIRDAFLTTFPGIEAKGCSFHFSKAILSKVGKSGFKGDYQSCPDFGSFVRAIFGLPYVPLSRLAEGVRNLYILAKKLDDRQAKFALVMIHYVQKTWINGSFPPETWNMYQHEGQTTNNCSEGYNNRLGNNKLGKHPNFYQWFETIKQELKISHDEATAAAAGKPQTKYRSSKDKKNMEIREKLMLDLKEGTTALMSYQKAVGGSLSRAERTCHCSTQ